MEEASATKNNSTNLSSNDCAPRSDGTPSKASKLLSYLEYRNTRNPSKAALQDKVPKRFDIPHKWCNL